MAKIINMNGKLLVRYTPGRDFLRRDITPSVCREINGKFSADPEAEQIYDILSEFVWERCFPVLSRGEIKKIIADFEMYDEPFEEQDCYELPSGRFLA